MNNDIREMCSEALICFDGLSVFSALRSQPIIVSFEALLTVIENANSKPRDLIKAWANFTQNFLHHAQNQTFFMWWTNSIIADENDFTLAAERSGSSIPPVLSELALSDLRRLAIISDFDIPMLALYITDELWRAGYEDMAQIIESGVRVIGELKTRNFDLSINEMPYSILSTQRSDIFADYIYKKGAGAFGQHCFFLWKRGAGFQPAFNPDLVPLDALAGYDEQRRIVLENTTRFAGGAPANNLLLYGDRGTGKSATVKAVCAALKDRRLRLIELNRRDIDDIPAILAAMGRRGIRFILFIDDLSFERQNDEFMMLKGLLEGGVERCPDNVLVYATSNRRHFIHEHCDDRSAAGDARAFDTVQEQLSLADRFGVTVIFTAPSRDEYLNIAEFLAERRGLFPDGGAPENRAAFRENALRWERWFNGRSPRTAHQFVDWAAGGATFPWEDPASPVPHTIAAK